MSISYACICIGKENVFTYEGSLSDTCETGHGVKRNAVMCVILV